MIPRTKFLEFIKDKIGPFQGVGVFTLYYMNLYDHFPTKKWFASWNWPAFFWGFFGMELVWMLYRRMYFYAILYMAALFGALTVLTVGTGIFMNIPFATVTPTGMIPLLMALKHCRLFLQMVLALAFGVWGNALYFSHVRRQLSRGSESQGGTSLGIPLLFMVIMLVVPFLLLKSMYPSFYDQFQGGLS